MSDRRTYEALHALGSDGDASLSVLDLARRLAVRTRDLAPLLRTLSVEPLFLRVLDDDGGLPTVTDGRTTYVCAWSSPTRLTAATAFEERSLTVQQVPLAELARRLPSDAGLLLDAQTEAALPLDPPHLREVRALAAGIPTRSALHAVDGEQLLVDPGPAERTPLDERVAALAPGAHRAAVRLDGAGGRDWPVYFLDDDALVPPVLEATGPTVVLVGTTGPVALQAARSRAVALADLRPPAGHHGGDGR